MFGGEVWIQAFVASALNKDKLLALQIGQITWGKSLLSLLSGRLCSPEQVWTHRTESVLPLHERFLSLQSCGLVIVAPAVAAS